MVRNISAGSNNINISNNNNNNLLDNAKKLLEVITQKPKSTTTISNYLDAIPASILLLETVKTHKTFIPKNTLDQLLKSEFFASEKFICALTEKGLCFCFVLTIKFYLRSVINT